MGCRAESSKSCLRECFFIHMPEGKGFQSPVIIIMKQYEKFINKKVRYYYCDKMTDEVTVMSVRGQIVIPKGVRKKLQLKPKDRLIVYGEEDTIIMKRLNLPELKETFEKIKQIAKERNRKQGRLSQKEIDKEVMAVRHAH